MNTLAYIKLNRATGEENTNLLQTLKSHIVMTVKCDDSEDKKLEIKVRLAEINEEFQKAMSLVSVEENNNVMIEQRLTELILERANRLEISGWLFFYFQKILKELIINVFYRKPV